jgi:2-C-methyl-D-erythritol 4-phosphate cytidylyltransferase
MSARVAALIPAAGSGERLGMGAKALLELNGITLLERAIRCLAPLCDEMVVALPSDQLGFELPDVVRKIAGGTTRQETVKRLLEATDADFVLVHDAARPFLPLEVAHNVLSAAKEFGSSTAALPAADTLVLEKDGNWEMLIDRSNVRAVQTPQGFDRILLLEAHQQAVTEHWEATDDAGLVARLGRPVALVNGDPRLFKVTKPGDWALAQAFARVWDAENR